MARLTEWVNSWTPKSNMSKENYMSWLTHLKHLIILFKHTIIILRQEHALKIKTTKDVVWSPKKHHQLACTCSYYTMSIWIIIDHPLRYNSAFQNTSTVPITLVNRKYTIFKLNLIRVGKCPGRLVNWART